MFTGFFFKKNPKKFPGFFFENAPVLGKNKINKKKKKKIFFYIKK